MESPPPAPPEVLPLLLECLSLAGQSNPGAGRRNQGPVKLMDELSGLAFWPPFRVARGRLLVKRTSVTTLMSVGSVDLFIHLLPLCCSLGTCWGQTQALSLEFGVW